MLNALFVYVYIIKIYLGKLFQFVWFQVVAEQDSSSSPHSHLFLRAHFREENDWTLVSCLTHMQFLFYILCLSN